MSQPDYYEIFGLSPSATPEEIRAAHRELVKRYHPDIYWTSEDKARATEKLRGINEAYAVLGNPERRKEYDASRFETSRSAERALQERPAHVRRVRRTFRPEAPARPVRARKKFQRNKKRFSFRWLAGAAACAGLFVAVAFLFTREPQYLSAWVLVQKTEVEPAGSGPLGGAKGWERLSSFGHKADCAQELRARVKQDERQGSHAVFDEAGGTVAITVQLIDSPPAAKEPGAGQARVTKRVRHYECRAVQIRQPDSWMGRKLQETGLLP